MPYSEALEGPREQALEREWKVGSAARQQRSEPQPGPAVGAPSSAGDAASSPSTSLSTASILSN